MSYILVSLWPLFVLILAGYGLRRFGFPGEGFWPGAERFNYYILFPALLFNSLSAAPLDHPALPRLLAAVMLVLFIATASLLVARRLRTWPASRFGVLLQGTLRFNTYLGLAAVSGLYGKEGMLFAAVILAVLVPAVNILSVLALSADNNRRVRSLLIPVAKNPLIRWIRRHMKVTDELHGEQFVVTKQKTGADGVRRAVRYVTPLFLVLVLVEFSDVIFAVDSIPAIFAITTDPFIVLTSNVFAILGLRAMYFLLAGMADRFSLLKYGLALVLIFIGAKMLLIDVYKIPVLVSLGVVAVIIATSIVLSLRLTAREGSAGKAAENRAD